jgi:two-component system chemotaxis sensor kinase CheA
LNVSKTESTTQNHWLNTFFQEAEDLLSEIDEAALNLSEGDALETINLIFRAFHTVKGSSGMCGLTAVADFTHHIETLLDKVRAGKIAATPNLAELVLAGSDQIRAIIAAEQGGEPVPAGSSEKIIAMLKEFSGEDAEAVEGATSAAPGKSDAVVPSDVGKRAGEQTWAIRFHPDPELFHCGGNPILVLRDLAALGTCSVTTHTDQVPPLDEIDPSLCYLWWTATLRSSASQNAIRDVFMFVEDSAELVIEAVATTEGEEVKVVTQTKATEIETTTAQAGASSPEAAKTHEPTTTRVLTKESTVRVPSARLDRLVNLVGELVMNQSRLTQIMTQVGVPELANPVQEIERLVAELRDDVLGIRMLPIGTLFGRFRRMVHDLARELGKEIELITEGADTEIDKSILDQLGEPLVHLLRNSIDHGIETPDVREAQGKPRCGTIRLEAMHVGSTVVVRIEDDGAGMDRAVIRAKAIERQLISSDAVLSDKEILNLIMAPGFSTAAKVTNVSGRGVGMDVVKRQIDVLRGSVLIASELGKGTRMSLTLPLTLAIIEGLLVQIGEDRMIFPMSAVTENFELHASARKRQNGRNVISVRGQLVPYIDLRALYQMGGDAPDIEKIVIVEHEEQRVGFVVDRVLGTHQTVLQPLGRFFRKVVVTSGATIMGDGGVALILDIASTIQMADRQARAGLMDLTAKAA